jgi:hypothetical protein
MSYCRPERGLDIYSGWEYGDLENPTEQNKGSG